jgi:hypothetical protein
VTLRTSDLTDQWPEGFVFQFEGLLFRRFIGPNGNSSEGSLVWMDTGPKVHWSEWSLVRKVTGPKCHWSEDSLVRRVRMSYRSDQWTFGTTNLQTEKRTLHSCVKYWYFVFKQSQTNKYK